MYEKKWINSYKFIVFFFEEMRYLSGIYTLGFSIFTLVIADLRTYRRFIANRR